MSVYLYIRLSVCVFSVCCRSIYLSLCVCMSLFVNMTGRAKGPLVPCTLYHAMLTAFQEALGHDDARAQAAALHPLLREVW